MSLRSRVFLVPPPMSGAFVAMALLAASPAHAQSAVAAAAGPFDALAGSWSGNGIVNTSDGLRERVRCQATYVAPNGGNSVRVDLRCASDSFKVELNGSIVQSGGSLSGNWFESTNRVGGRISGRASGGQIDARAEGDTFTAMLSVKTTGNRQSFQMESPGSKVSEVSIAFNRASR